MVTWCSEKGVVFKTGPLCSSEFCTRRILRRILRIKFVSVQRPVEKQRYQNRSTEAGRTGRTGRTLRTLRTLRTALKAHTTAIQGRAWGRKVVVRRCKKTNLRCAYLSSTMFHSTFSRLKRSAFRDLNISCKFL